MLSFAATAFFGVKDKANTQSDLMFVDIARFIFTFFALIVVGFLWFDNFQRKRGKHCAKPRVTLKFRFFNFLLWPTKEYVLHREFQPLNFEKLKKFATKKTGLSDFGEDTSFFDHAFNFGFKLANEASYSPVGWIGLQAFMKRLLIAKLRVIQELKEADTKDFCKNNPIEKPIFICGLPRTGTTFLQRLLSLDPSNTSPQTWELVDPVPRIKSDLQKDKKKRIKYCQKSLNDFLEVTPHFNEVHEMGAEIAEECTVMMALDAPAVMMNFHTILARQDEVYDWEWHKAYKNYYKGLQIIKKYRLERKEETNQSNKRWVLKAPPHIGQLDQLIQAFPDARIIWNHRDPKECVPSFASLIRAGQDFAEGSGTIELDALGKQVMKYADKMYTSGDKFFEDVKAGNCPSSCRCSHVMYKNLIKNPVGTVESLYESFGYEFTADYKKAIEDYLEEDKRKRDSLKGKKAVLHGYTAEEYGLTDQEIDETFAWYRSKYFSAK